jgi:hypothetical protein
MLMANDGSSRLLPPGLGGDRRHGSITRILVPPWQLCALFSLMTLPTVPAVPYRYRRRYGTNNA